MDFILQSLTNIMIITSVGITIPLFGIDLYPNYGPLTAIIDFITISAIFYYSIYHSTHNPFSYSMMLVFFVIFIPKLFGFKQTLLEFNHPLYTILFGIIYLLTINLIIINVL